MSLRLRSQVLVLLLLVSAPSLYAQTASLVADLSTHQPASTGQLSLPDGLLAFHGKLVFSASEASSGRELWVSDGEDRGTRMLADFCPGRCDSLPEILGATATAVVGTTRVDTQLAGRQFLWRSDGTRQGTYLLPSADDPLDLGYAEDVVEAVFLGSRIYLSGCNHEQGCGLWSSDGTPAGTQKVKNADFEGAVFLLAAGSHRLFFVDYPNTLWVSDGTPAGTHAVKEIPSGVGLITALGDRAIFIAHEPDGGELWVSDGTEVGTRALTSFATPDPFEQTLWLKPMGGKVYFVADDVVHGAEIWATDGTPTGTRQVTDIGFHDPFQASEFDPIGLRATDLELLGDRLVFWATDGLHGFQPWSTRGLPQPTAPLCSSCSFTNPRAALVKSGPRLLFTGLLPQQGAAQVWTTDGTTPGTTFLHTACTSRCENTVLDPVAFLDSAFFTVLAGARTEMWRSDGTPAGTSLYASPSFGSPRLAVLGSNLFYSSGELWESDGTPAGTRLVTDIAHANASTDFDSLTAAGHNLYFAACGENGSQLYGYSDGTASGTRQADPHIGCVGVGPAASIAGSWLFLQRDLFSSSYQLRRMSSDGNLEQLTQLPGNSSFSGLAVLGDRLYFAAGIQDGPWAIWRSDGTVQGTVKVADLPRRSQRLLSDRYRVHDLVHRLQTRSRRHHDLEHGRDAGRHPAGSRSRPAVRLRA